MNINQDYPKLDLPPRLTVMFSELCHFVTTTSLPGINIIFNQGGSTQTLASDAGFHPPCITNMFDFYMSQ